MTAYMDPAGGTKPLFAADGALALARETGLELYAEVPFDPELGTSTDRGRPFVIERPDSPAARALESLADRIEAGRGGRFSP
jgi:MinD-like ATPase involved in chromosome partitioning or flagellar assembly